MRNIAKSLFVIFTVLTLFYVILAQHHLESVLHPQNAQTELTTIRCGYITYPPYFEHGAKTNQPKGLMVDIMNQIAQRAGLKLEWREETTWATMFEGFKTGRYDAVCSGIWPNAARAKYAMFSDPVIYVAEDAYGRAGQRTQKHISDLNQTTLTTVTIDGEISSTLRDQRLPTTHNLSLPQQTPVPDMLMAVTGGKADIALVERRVADDFLIHNPGTIARISDEPAAQFPVVIPIAPDHAELERVINVALNELRLSGDLAKIVSRYEIPGSAEPSFLLSPKTSQ